MSNYLFFTFTITSKKHTDLAFKSTIKNGTYYYVYTTYENSDGMFIDLSDITIAMVKRN